MSHKKDYTKYSKPDYIKTEAAPAKVEEVEVVNLPYIKETVVETPEPVIGKVEGCKKLNVRKEPDTEADVVCVVPEGTEVIVDEEESTVDFYKVCTSAGIEGFCMKKFISVV